jgi:O-antigen/teichoic acid export membrane protein
LASLKKQFGLNVLSGWCVQAASIASGFLMLPYAISRLGQENYGVYQLAASMIALFMLMQLGMGTTLVRYYSKANAQNDDDKIATNSSSAFLILGVIGIFGSCICLLSMPFFIRFYDIPNDLKAETYGLLICMSLSFLLRIIMPAITGLLISANRYDIYNTLLAFSHLNRLFMLIALFELIKPSIFLFGIVILLNTFILLVASFLFAYKIYGRSIIFKFSKVDLDIIRDMFGFSINTFTISVCSAAAMQAPVLMIGKFMGAENVTLFSPAVTMANALNGFLSATVSPMIPIASRDAICNSGKNLGRWAMLGARYISFFGLGLLFVWICLGEWFLGFWLGDSFVQLWPVVSIYMLGAVIGKSQGVTASIAIGGSTLKPFTVSWVLTAVFTITFLWTGMFFFSWGLLGVAICCVSLRAFRNLFFIPWIYSKILKFSYNNMMYNYLKVIILFLLCFAVYIVLKTFNMNNVIAGFIAIMIYSIIGIRNFIPKEHHNWLFIKLKALRK